MKILITSGPTREYLDPIRFLSNDSSGKMGQALAQAALDRGFQVVLVTGPVVLDYPQATEVHRILTTAEMQDACLHLFPECDGVIGAAAPCDYRPAFFSEKKLSKSTFDGHLELVKTPDVLASLGKIKQPGQRIVAFALETDDSHNRAMQKLREKNADCIILNDPKVIGTDETRIEILYANGFISERIQGKKINVARKILDAYALL